MVCIGFHIKAFDRAWWRVKQEVSRNSWHAVYMGGWSIINVNAS